MPKCLKPFGHALMVRDHRVTLGMCISRVATEWGVVNGTLGHHMAICLSPALWKCSARVQIFILSTGLHVLSSQETRLVVSLASVVEFLAASSFCFWEKMAGDP